MFQNWQLRLKALVLLAVFMSGGAGMSILDVALFHTHSPTHSFTSHFEAGGIPHAHGDSCRLGTSLPHTPVPKRLDLVIPVVGASFCALLPAPSVRLPSPDFGLFPRPRAPPTLLA